MGLNTHTDLMMEQLAYYRAGASEYDQANRALLICESADGKSRRRGYSHAINELDSAARSCDVLEIAGGTGVYTRHLVTIASRLTVIDASPESLEVSRSSIGGARINVDYVSGDVFEWVPPRRFQVVVFAFWLSHVPHPRFEEFWRLVDRALVDGGSVVFVDSRAPTGDLEPDGDASTNFFSEARIDGQTSVRSLGDGRRFRIVRVMWQPQALQERLTDLGWQVQINEESPWLVGRARRTV